MDFDAMHIQCEDSRAPILVAQKDSSQDHCWPSGASYWSDANLRHTWLAFSCSNMTKPVTMISSTHGWPDWESQLFYNFNSAWEPFTLQRLWIKFLTIHFTKHAAFWREREREIWGHGSNPKQNLLPPRNDFPQGQQKNWNRIASSSHNSPAAH